MLYADELLCIYAHYFYAQHSSYQQWLLSSLVTHYSLNRWFTLL